MHHQASAILAVGRVAPILMLAHFFCFLHVNIKLQVSTYASCILCPNRCCCDKINHLINLYLDSSKSDVLSPKASVKKQTNWNYTWNFKLVWMDNNNNKSYYWEKSMAISVLSHPKQNHTSKQFLSFGLWTQRSKFAVGNVSWLAAVLSCFQNYKCHPKWWLCCMSQCHFITQSRQNKVGEN